MCFNPSDIPGTFTKNIWYFFLWCSKTGFRWVLAFSTRCLNTEWLLSFSNWRLHPTGTVQRRTSLAVWWQDALRYLLVSDWPFLFILDQKGKLGEGKTDKFMNTSTVLLVTLVSQQPISLIYIPKCNFSLLCEGILNIFLVATVLPLCVTVATQVVGVHRWLWKVVGPVQLPLHFLRQRIILVIEPVVSKGSQTCTYSYL